jgi:hypothetical protein
MDGILTVYSALLALYAWRSSPVHGTFQSALYATTDSPFLLKIELSSRPSRPNFNSRAGFYEKSMSSEVVQADQMAVSANHQMESLEHLAAEIAP